MDLSHPCDGSVNEGIDPALCSLSYVTVVRAVQALATGTLMAKVDIKVTYRLMLVHPDDAHCLVCYGAAASSRMRCYLFSFHSSPKIFNTVADELEWCLHQRGVKQVYHYLNNFITIGPLASDQCQNSINIVNKVCNTLCVPLGAQKHVGPTLCLTFLGIEINSVESTLKLLEDKLECLLEELQHWGDRKVCTSRELESLIGLISHASKVIHPGRTFL